MSARRAVNWSRADLGSTVAIAILGVSVAIVVAASQGDTARFMPFADARPIMDALARERWPAALRQNENGDRQAAWADWIARRDAEIRQRVERGDEDTIVYWLLFGSSFTTRPRAFLDISAGTPTIDALIGARARDLARALALPGHDERRLFAKALYERQGFRVDSTEARARLERHWIAEVARMADNQERWERELDEAQQRRNPNLASSVFRDRGLSLDTSFWPNFAVESSLKRLQQDGRLSAADVARVAIIGPGLDFADGRSGYDFYPPQTLQPFALIDSLHRLKLVDRDRDLEVTAFDINPRVRQHLDRARTRAIAGNPYEIVIPLDRDRSWTPDLVDYWKQFGSLIAPPGRSSTHSTPSGMAIATRRISVRPSIVSQVAFEELNIALHRYQGAPFDLVIATNIFLDYDVFEQSLGLANVAAMLRPGGYLLSNTFLVELPDSKMHTLGQLTTLFTAQEGDTISLYQRSRD